MPMDEDPPPINYDYHFQPVYPAISADDMKKISEPVEYFNNDSSLEWYSLMFSHVVKAEEGVFGKWADSLMYHEFTEGKHTPSDLSARKKWSRPSTWKHQFIESNLLMGNSLSKSVLTEKWAELKVGQSVGFSKMKILSEGTSNTIIEPPEQVVIDKLTSQDEYPPQLKDLERGSYIFRVTKLVPKCCKDVEDCVKEIRLTLDAAYRGFGPAVFAAIIVPLDVETKKTFATVFVLLRYHTNLQSVHNLIWPNHKAYRQFTGSSEEILAVKTKVDKLARSIWMNLTRMGRAGFVHFDLKCLNVVVKTDTFDSAVIDFEDALCKVVKIKRVGMRKGEAMGRWRGVLVTNALMLLAHVRAFTPVWFAEQLVASMRPILIETVTKVAKDYIADESDGGEWFLMAEFVDDSKEEHRYKQRNSSDSHSLQSIFIGIHNYYFRDTKEIKEWEQKFKLIYDSIRNDYKQHKRKEDILQKESILRNHYSNEMRDSFDPRAQEVVQKIVSCAVQCAVDDTQNKKHTEQLKKTLNESIITASRPYNAHHPPHMWNVFSYGIPPGGMLSQLLRFAVLWERNIQGAPNSARTITTDDRLKEAFALLHQIGTRPLYTFRMRS